MNPKHWRVAAACLGAAVAAPGHAATVLFSEGFNGITAGYVSESCGSGCSHKITNGVPTSGGGNTVNGGADEDWYGARFERPDNGRIVEDVGAQQVGGNTPTGNNPTPVGLVQDDAGLMLRLDTTGFTNISLTFDWRTFATESGDRLVVGYFVGDLDAGHPTGFAADRTIDLRPISEGGPGNGAWNWAGFGGQWIELMRSRNERWTWDQAFSLTLADNAPEVWVAFWLDNGNLDNGKMDNVVVAAHRIVPLPAAAWLLGAGFLGYLGLGRSRREAVEAA